MSGKKSGSSIKSIILAFFFVGIVLLYFNHLSDKASERRTNKEKNDIETLMDYDMMNDYPKTPRDVVKLHNQYMKLFYGKKLKDDEIKDLNHQVINLYSDELMKYNTEVSIYNDLKTNIKEMANEGYVYLVCALPEVSQIKMYEQDGKEMATLEVEITLDTKEEKGYLYNQYVLVKENGLWKILVWGDSKMRENENSD